MSVDDEITRAMIKCGVGHLPDEYLKVCKEAVRLAQEKRRQEPTTEDVLSELWACGARTDGAVVQMASPFGMCDVNLPTFDAFRAFLAAKRGEKTDRELMAALVHRLQTHVEGLSVDPAVDKEVLEAALERLG